MLYRSVFQIQFLRFLIVGGLNTAFSYSVYAALLYLGLNYFLANLLAFLIGVVFSFKTQGVLVFRNTDNKLLFRFLATWIVIYFVNIGLVRFSISIGFNDYLAGLVALPLVVAFSYVAQRSVFRRSAENQLNKK